MDTECIWKHVAIGKTTLSYPYERLQKFSEYDKPLTGLIKKEVLSTSNAETPDIYNLKKNQ